MRHWRRAMAGVAMAWAAATACAQTTEIAARVQDAQGRPVPDAVVVAVPVDGNPRLPARAREEVVDQVDKEFVPRVQAVLVGTPVRFPNNDNVRHQVYSFSPAKRFELPLYAGVPAQPVVFDKPGVVVLGCNIHDWMIGYVYVSESPARCSPTCRRGPGCCASGIHSSRRRRRRRARPSTPRASGAPPPSGRSRSSRSSR